MYVGNVMLLILNLPLVGLFVQILEVPRAWLTSIILIVCLVGVYSTNSAAMDILLAVLFGVVGYILRRYGYDLGIVILAYVLGGVFERSLRQALAISDGDLAIFVSTPLTITFAVITAVLVVIALVPRRAAPKPAQVISTPTR